LTAGAWQKHKLVRTNLSVAELTDALSPSVGGGLFIDGTYKNAVLAGGTMTMEARLQGSLGYLLYAAAGSYSATATGTSAKGTRFYVDQANQTQLPWMAVRRYTPGSLGTDGVTEYMIDCKVSNMTLTIPQMGPMIATCGLVGRRPQALDGEITANTSAYETASGVALSCKSNVNLTFDPIGAIGTAYNVTDSSVEAFMGAEITMVNNLTGPQQEIVIGSYYMDDIAALTRGAVITLVYKWKNPKLYDRLFYAAAQGTSFAATDWTPIIQTGAATISSVSAAGTPSMNFVTPSMNWTIAAPQLVGGQLLTTTVTGVVTETNVAATAPWYIDLFNSHDYATNFAP
jgi:hypothetical protein